MCWYRRGQITLLLSPLAVLFVLPALVESHDCETRISQAPGALARVISTSGENGGFGVAWQSGQDLFFQRFRQDCKSSGSALLVVRDENFWRQPGPSGLNDVVTLSQDAGTIVAWTLNGSIWFRIVHSNNSMTEILSAAGDDLFDRSSVRIIANPMDVGSFMLVWTSWGQDHDGWGVFARPFNMLGKPEREDFQVNLAWRHFQWQPQVVTCGDGSVWATWTNSSGEVDSETGPFLRFIGHATSDGWVVTLGEELNSGGRVPVATSLACAAPSPVSGTSSFFSGSSITGRVELVWLETTPSSLDVKVVAHDPPPGRRLEGYGQGFSIALGMARSWVISGHEFLMRSAFDYSFVSLRLPSQKIDLLAAPMGNVTADSHRVEHGRFDQIDIQLGPPPKQQTHQKTQQQQHSSSGRWQRGAGRGQISTSVLDGYLAVLSVTEGGKVGVQLVKYGESRTAVGYPPRHVSESAHFAQIAWDTSTPDHHLLVCWAEGVPLDSTDFSDPANFVCARHTIEWLKYGGVPDLGGRMVLILVSVLLLMFICLRRCGPDVALRQRAVAARRAQQTTSRARQLAQARNRDVRDQLAAIPSAPLEDEGGESRSSLNGSVSVAQAAAQTAATNRAAAQAAAAAAEPPSTPGAALCTICQGEVVVRVVLKKCGHTACRDCVSRLVELGQPCHMCRGEIEGVQAVYL